MKQFFGGCLGAFVGVIVGVIIFVIVLAGVIAKSFSDAADFKKSKTKVEAKSESPVLKINLKGEIKETARKDVWSFNVRDLLSDKDLVLSELVRSIEVAAKDENIKGIYIRIHPFSASTAQLEELRKALENFKKSGKWIYVYADNYFQGDYYLASVADTVMMPFDGILLWKGIASQITFFKKALEKLDIQVQVFRHGKFKSAVEPFMLDKMSDENRQQMRALIGSIWNGLLNDVSRSRKISAQQLNLFANELSIKDAEDALKYKMIDVVANESEVEELIKKKTGTDGKNIFTDYHQYKFKAEEKYEGKNKVAVIYASGQIVDYTDDGNDEVIVPSDFLKTLKEVEKDDNIKAVVIRVNSPGGSASASEKIWQAIKKLKSKKPVVVSFGEVAASGGYYISCGADYIFTDQNTITGSIGVFGILPNLQKLMEKDLGLYTDTVKTNTYADLTSVLRPVQPKEEAMIMYKIEKVYDTFLSRVSEGRKLDKTYIDNIGQGRVWSGADAVKLKLADKVGTLEDAIAYAAEKANIKEYGLKEFPKKKSPFDELMEQLNGDNDDEESANTEDVLTNKLIKANTGRYYKDILILKKSLKNRQVNYLTLMPYSVELY
ncbi:MAG: signal peptide peptidase SppA [Bacteroidia bacterium]|nr:MAG: signal peptide peptidase SppA [Bacteroidia bacterium]